MSEYTKAFFEGMFYTTVAILAIIGAGTVGWWLA